MPLIFIVEPMIPFSNVPNLFWKKTHVNKLCLNKRDPLMPNLWALWGKDVAFTLVFVSTNCIVFELDYNQTKMYIANIYASTSYLQLRLGFSLMHLMTGHLTLFFACFSVI